MQVDPSTLIALLSLTVAAIAAFGTMRRNHKQDDKKESAEFTTLLVKFESMSNTLAEVKADTRCTRDDMQLIRERLAKVEQSVETAHTRIDKIAGKGSGI